MSKKEKNYTPGFKIKIIKLKMSNKMTTEEICEKYNLDRATVNEWVRQFDEGGKAEIERKEMERKIKRLEMEKEILLKAHKHYVDEARKKL